MAHLDLKNVGRIPEGGGWCIHGRHSERIKTVDRAKNAGSKTKTTGTGHAYLHSVVDGFARLAYTEASLDEKGTTAVGGGPRASRLTTVQPSHT